MKILIKIFLTVLFALTFTSCSLFYGGLVYLDNSFYKGEKEISLEKVIKLRKGDKIIIGLIDSTEVSGFYNSYEESDERNQSVKNIIILDTNNVPMVIKTSEVSKYIYIDEGGNVWTAIAIGAVVDTLIIYVGSKSKHSGPSIKLF